MNKWISVKDRLPKVGQEVLVKLNNIKGTSISRISFMHCTDATGKQFTYKHWSGGRATHWMPFLSPPKNKNDKY